jgi:hypothetical protein
MADGFELSLARQGGEAAWRRREECLVPAIAIDQAVSQAMALPGPVGLIDEADDPAGGVSADSVAILPWQARSRHSFLSTGGGDTSRRAQAGAVPARAPACVAAGRHRTGSVPGRVKLPMKCADFGTGLWRKLPVIEHQQPMAQAMRAGSNSRGLG